MSEAQTLPGSHDFSTVPTSLIRELDFNLDNTPVSINRVAQIVQDNKTQIIEGVRRHCYWPLKRLTANRHDNSYQDYTNMAAFIKDEDRSNSAVIKVFLGPQTQDRERQSGIPALEFRFSSIHSVNNDDVDFFTTPDDFVLNGVNIVTGSFDKVKRFPVDRVAQGHLDTELESATIQLRDLQRQLTWILEPEEDYSHSRKMIQELAKQYGITEAEAEQLGKAVHEFGNYYHTDKKTRVVSQIGMCFTTPGEFERFCERKFNLHLENAHYGKDSGESGYHAVSTYERKIVFDWTHRQYESGNYDLFPYPYIYPSNEKLPKWLSQKDEISREQ